MDQSLVVESLTDVVDWLFSCELVLDEKSVCKRSEKINCAWKESDIDKATYIREVKNKGRCLFTRFPKKKGEVIFCEKQLCATVPSLDQQLWNVMLRVCTLRTLFFGISFHYATLVSILSLDQQKIDRILNKWYTEDGVGGSELSKPILEYLLKQKEVTEHPGFMKLKLTTPEVYHNLVLAWRYNSFQSSDDSSGLVMYDRISMMAHSCAPSCVMMDDYSTGISCLISKTDLPAGGELTITYLSESDLLKSTVSRRILLNEWKFICTCDHCILSTDLSRGFKCIKCKQGSLFTSKVKGNTVLLPCNVCYFKPSNEQRMEFLKLEFDFLNLLDSTRSNDRLKIERMMSHAYKCFNQHWILFRLNEILIKINIDSEDKCGAIILLCDAIYYHLSAYPFYTKILGNMYANINKLINECFSLDPSYRKSPLNGLYIFFSKQNELLRSIS